MTCCMHGRRDDAPPGQTHSLHARDGGENKKNKGMIERGYDAAILFSKLESLTQSMMKRKSTRWKEPKNTPVNDPKAVERTSPPRCAMQGPIRGEPPS